MKTRTKTIVLTAILVAIMLLFGFTPIGYIPLPFAKFTLMCIPLIIGVLCMGWKIGLVLSGIFILTSICQLPMDPVSYNLFSYNPVLFILTLIVPRICIPFIVCLVKGAVGEAKPKLSYALSSIAGSLTNTFLYLLMLQIFFVEPLAVEYTVDASGVSAIIWFVVLTNGLPEAAIAALVCTPIVKALKKSAAY